MATNTERRELTRAKIVQSARAHFARDGYENTPTDSILESAGVSRGAMYHHFPSKKALFEAVFIAISGETIEYAGQKAEQHDSPLKALISVCTAWLEAVREADIAAILLDQGPQVLGWKKARDLEAKLSLAPMKRYLKLAAQAAEIKVDSVELTARLLNALLAEAALARLHQQPPLPDVQLESAVRQFIQALSK